MQALRLPAARGWQWIVQGFRLYRSNVPLLTFLLFGYVLVLLVIDLVPRIGPITASLCVPALSLVVMNGCRAIERRQPLGPEVLLDGLRGNGATMLRLGGCYLLGTLGVFAIITLAGDGELLRLLHEGAPAAMDEAARGRLMLSAALAGLAMTPFAMAFWFAPMLSGWHGCGALKALFFSFVACWRNWRAFLVYGLAAGALAVAAPGVLVAAAALVSVPATRFLAGLLTVVLLFVFMPTLFASFYTSYCEVFVPATGDAQPA
ncbi:MAG: BPSS1780 family membrane protein [Rhodocyclaceae bacterium]